MEKLLFVINRVTMKATSNCCVKLFYFLVFTLYPIASIAQSGPAFEWAKNSLSYFNGTISYANYGVAICTDEAANNYTLGWFTGTMYFDFDSLVASAENAYLVSLDSSGNLRWIKHFDCPDNSFPTDLVYD